jgi:glucose/arabinose dehydrogenase
MKHLLCVLTITLFGWTVQLSAQTFPSGFSKSNIGSGWNQPVGAAFTKDGTKLFVWEKGGKVYLCKWNTTTLVYDKQTTPVLDISPEVGNWRDHGLLGFAVDPNFANNGLIYLLYVVDRHHLMNFGTGSYNAFTNDYFKATIGRVTRYQTITSGGNVVADVSTRTILIGESKTTGIPILYESHGVGSLAFAADGTLLVSAGDGASYNVADAGSLGETYYAQALTDGIIRDAENVGAFRSQVVNSMSGKILRIDPATGDGISSNPFYLSSDPRAPQSRVWAMGFRNPFRFSIRPNTGSLSPTTGDIGEIYVGDVGWDRYEELNVVERAGANCGWPIFEGLTYQSAYAGLNTANKDEPNPLFGTGGCTQQYFAFKDLIKQATADKSTSIYNPCDGTALITSSNNNRFVHRLPSIDWKHSTDSARVGIFSGNNVAIAQIGSAASNVTGTPFQGNCSIGGCWYTGTMFPPAYQNTFFQADYGAAWLKSMNIQYTDVVTQVDTFAKGFTAIVGVVENPLDGSLVYVDVGSNRIGKIKYSGNQPPVADATSDKIYGPSTLAVTFTGSNSSDPEGGPLTYNWDFGDGTTSTVVNPPTHSFSAAGPQKFVVVLKVTDNQNAVSTDKIIISVNNTPPVVNIASPIKNAFYRLGADTTYSLTATVTDAEQGPDQLKYEWQTFLRHNTHQHPEPVDTNKATTAVISRIGCNGDTYYWFIKLKVTDDAGLSAVDSAMIFPNCLFNSTLPLILRSFSVAAQSGGNLVKWITESETDLQTFVVERSTDGHQFIPIDLQEARGNGSGQTQYSFLDNTFPSGDSYYRLKMVDKTTGYYFSMVIRVFTGLARQDQLLVVPNPVENDFTLGGFFNTNGSVQIQISDAGGRIIQSFKETVSNGFNNMQVSVPNHLPSGIYFIEVKENNTVRKTKFIKVP